MNGLCLSGIHESTKVCADLSWSTALCPLVYYTGGGKDSPSVALGGLFSYPNLLAMAPQLFPVEGSAIVVANNTLLSMGGINSAGVVVGTVQVCIHIREQLPSW